MMHVLSLLLIAHLDHTAPRIDSAWDIPMLLEPHGYLRRESDADRLYEQRILEIEHPQEHAE